MDGCLDGCEDRLGLLESSMLGRLLGSDDGSLDKLGREDGSDVGLSETDGCVEGCTLAMPDSEGLIEDWLLGWDDWHNEGRPNKVGLSLGCDISRSKKEELTDG